MKERNTKYTAELGKMQSKNGVVIICQQCTSMRIIRGLMQKSLDEICHVVCKRSDQIIAAVSSVLKSYELGSTSNVSRSIGHKKQEGPYSDEFAIQTRQIQNKQDTPENSRKEITGMWLLVKIQPLREHCRFITSGHHVRNEQRGGL